MLTTRKEGCELKEKKIRKRKTLKEQFMENKLVFICYMLLRIIVIAMLVLGIFRKNFETTFYCALTLVLFLLPNIAEKSLNITLPTVLEIIILLFIFSAEILGELQCYYIKFPFWDTMLHTINGFLCAAIGFSLVRLLNRNQRFDFQLSPLYMAVVAFCFSMTVGVLWEFFEFTADYFFYTDMQKDAVVNHISSVLLNEAHENTAVTIDNIKSVVVNGKELGVGGYIDIGLYDTMKDLFVNFIGAVVFSVIGYFNVKLGGKSKFAKNFIPMVNMPSNDSENSVLPDDEIPADVKSEKKEVVCADKKN